MKCLPCQGRRVRGRAWDDGFGRGHAGLGDVAAAASVAAAPSVEAGCFREDGLDDAVGVGWACQGVFYSVLIGIVGFISRGGLAYAHLQPRTHTFVLLVLFALGVSAGCHCRLTSLPHSNLRAQQTPEVVVNSAP